MKHDSITLPSWFNLLLIMLITIPLLTACSAATTIANGADFAVSKYCKIPSAGRSAVREAVGRAVHPNSIKITCHED
jgi:hypothetical protein